VGSEAMSKVLNRGVPEISSRLRGQKTANGHLAKGKNI